MYKQLPSFIRDNATTYDMRVANLLISWENKQYEESMNPQPAAPKAQKLSQEEMMRMIKSVRGT